MAKACTSLQAQLDKLKIDTEAEIVKSQQRATEEREKSEKNQKAAAAWKEKNDLIRDTLVDSTGYLSYSRYTKDFVFNNDRYLIDSQILEMMLDKYDNLFSELITVRKQSEHYDADMLFSKLLNVKLRDGLTAKAEYKTDGRNGATDIFAVDTDSSRVALADSMVVANLDLHAAIEAHIVIYMTLLYGNADHGYYGRDYTFVTDQSRLANLIQNNGIPLDNIAGTFSEPAGMRVCKKDNMITVGMLASFPNGSIVDTLVYIDTDGGVKAETQEVYTSKTVVLY